MTADFKMKFDDGGTPEGLEKTADAGDKAAESLKEVGQSGAQAAEAMGKTGDQASAAAGDVQKLTSDLNKESKATQDASKATDQLGKEIDQATREAGEFSASLDDATKKAKALAVAEQEAAAKAKDFERAQKNTKEQAEGTKEGLEGFKAILEVLGYGALAYVIGMLAQFTEGIIKVGKAISTISWTAISAGIATVGTALAGVVATIGLAVTAFGALAYVVYRVIVPTRELADANNIFDTAMANAMFTSKEFREELLNLKEVYKQDEERLKAYVDEVDRATKSQMEASKEAESLYERLETLKKTIDQSKDDYSLNIEIGNLDSTAAVDERINAIKEGLDDIRNRDVANAKEKMERDKELADALEQGEKELGLLLQRRIQLLDEVRKAKQAEIDLDKERADKQKKIDEDNSKSWDEQVKKIEQDSFDQADRDKKEHEKELARIKAEGEARQKARDAAIKQAIEARNARIDEIAKAKESTETQVDGIQQVQQAQQQAEEKKSPYGEGEAPTAGQDAGNNPYAAAIDPFSQFTSDFNFAGNSYTETSMNPNGKGSNSSSNRKVTNKAVEEQLQQFDQDELANLRNKYGIGESQSKTIDEFEKTARKMVKDTGNDIGLSDDLSGYRKRRRDVEQYERKNFQKAAAGKDTGEDASVQEDRQSELVDAGQKLLDETKQTSQERKSMMKDQLDVTKELAQNQADDRAEIAAQKADLESIKQIMRISAQRAQAFRKGPSPSSMTSQARANP